jgi:uncharacterized metal-binding protein
MRSRPSALRDFTVDRRTWLLTAVAIVIGTGAAGLAVLLLKAIAVATNIFYYHRISLATVAPAGSTQPHWVMLLVPVLGGLIVGFMAHYGSDAGTEFRRRSRQSCCAALAWIPKWRSSSQYPQRWRLAPAAHSAQRAQSS